MKFIKEKSLYLAANILLLVLSMLFAAQIRLQVPLGKSLSSGYRAQSPELYLLLVGVAIAAYMFSFWAGAVPVARVLLSPDHPFRRFVVTALIAAAWIMLLLPDISLLQLVYFCLVSVLFSIMAIVIPMRVYAGQNDLLNDFRQLWRSRFLILIWLRNNIETRYSQTFLGIAWIVLIPLTTAAVLTFAFTQLVQIEIDAPFISFFMSGLVPFGLFQAGVFSSANAILARAGLITQAYFPREVLILVKLGEALLDFFFAFIVMLVINLLFGVYPNPLYIYLPFLLLLLLALTLGFMLIVSAMSVLIQDIPQLIGVAVQLIFYLTPVIYPVEYIPDQYQVLFAINPVASIVVAFRDIIVFNRTPDWVTLYYPVAMSSILLFLGYSIFKEIEDKMADLA